jgi:hypothetical protein
MQGSEGRMARLEIAAKAQRREGNREEKSQKGDSRTAIFLPAFFAASFACSAALRRICVSGARL